MKRILFLLLVGLNGFFVKTAIAQKGFFVAKDYRINGAENDLIMYLIKEKQVMDIKTPFKIEDYQNQIVVWKCLEIYSGGSSNLLIGFSTTADHGDKFWAVLNDKEKYLFYDMRSEGFLKFKKDFDQKIVALVELYLSQHIITKSF
jgi:hypothetical protein